MSIFLLSCLSRCNCSGGLSRRDGTPGATSCSREKGTLRRRTVKKLAAIALFALSAVACQPGEEQADSSSFWLDNQSGEALVVTYATTEAYGSQIYEQPIWPNSRIVLQKASIGSNPSDVIDSVSISMSNSTAAVMDLDPVTDGMWRADGKSDLGSELTETYTLVVTQDSIH